MFRKTFLGVLSILIVSSLSTFALEILTNEKIIELVEANLSDELIVTLITNSEGDFKTDVNSILSLKERGVSEDVIQAMIEKSAAGNSTNAPSENLEATPQLEVKTGPSDISTDTGVISLPEVGVYYSEEGGELVFIEPEMATWKTGGFWKRVATVGLTKGHVNGVVTGKVSEYVLKGDEDFYIYTMEGTSAREYQLLDLWEKDNRREFRAITGGIIHASGGAEENQIAFEPTRIAPRTYNFKLPGLAPGEYGLLSPSGMTGEADLTSGKIYAFSVGK